LQLELSSTDRRVDLVREGFDCVLRVGALLDSSLIARPVGQYRMINCASPRYIAETACHSHRPSWTGTAGALPGQLWRAGPRL
jgi:DNA-binding transcriptional LysR family regulator